MEEKLQFFDFEFIIDEFGELLECNYTNEETGRNHELIMNKEVADSLFKIYKKYMKKVKQHKIDKKKLTNQQKEREARSENKDHLQEHIRKSEAKISEYKNVILAFGKLATCSSISK